MKVKLWTITDEKGWTELQNKGVLRGKEEFVEPDFKMGYDWLKVQMNERIGCPDVTEQYPVWAWYQADNAKKKRPDLRSTAHLPKGEIGYRIEIEKEEKDILLSDIDLWLSPLCYKIFIADSEEDYNQFYSDIKKKYHTESYFELPEYIKNIIEKSWEKIFDMDYDVEYFAKPFYQKSIQATFWELNNNEILSVDKFKAR